MITLREDQKTALEEAIKRANATTTLANEFANTAILDPRNLRFEAGDEFTIPDDFNGQVHVQMVNGNKANFLIVVTQNNVARYLYPSVFCRNIQTVNADGTPTGITASASGSACDLFKQGATYAEGMELLRGKKLKVTKVDMVSSIRPGTNLVRHGQPVYTIDLVD